MQRKTFEAIGCVVDDACPDLAGADSVFLTIRAWRSATVYGPLLDKYRDQLKPEAIGEIESGLALGSAEVAWAMIQHGQLMEQVRRSSVEKYEFILCAVNQVPPFDAAMHWPITIEGVKMDHYVAWMKSAYWITATYRPAISSCRVHTRFIAGRPSDRRPLSRRPRRASDGSRVRTRDRLRTEATPDCGDLIGTHCVDWQRLSDTDPGDSPSYDASPSNESHPWPSVRI